MTLTLPAPVVSTPSSPYTDQRGRTRKITYTFTEATAEQDGAAVIVTVSHSKTRKAYLVSIQPVRVEKRDGFTVTTFMGFSGVSVARIPAARFSAKDLDAHTAKTIENVPVMIAADTDIARIFAAPGQSSTEMFPR